MKLHRLHNGVLRAIGNLGRRTLVREMHVAFKIPYVYSSSSSIGLSCDRSIASSKVLERDYPGKVVMW
jgi:hypothetical protein